MGIHGNKEILESKKHYITLITAQHECKHVTRGASNPNELTQGTRKWKDNSRQAERKQPNRTGTTPAHTERAHIMNSYRPTARCTTPQPATPHPHQKVAVVQIAKRTERFKHQFFLEPIHKLRCCRALSSLFPQAHLFMHTSLSVVEPDWSRRVGGLDAIRAVERREAPNQARLLSWARPKPTPISPFFHFYI